jgi:hypothetical protein
MFATFEKQIGPDRTSYRSGKQVKLFGCNEGWIPWFVKLSAPTGQNEPYAWHVRIDEALALPDVRAEFPNAEAILIDIKPSAKDSFVLCELLDVYGYSTDEWTPMLWRMRVLANAGPKDNHLEDFDAPNDGAIIYNFVYAMGSVTDGVPSGKWIAPGPSSTNGVLLWPEALKYFMGCIQAR